MQRAFLAAYARRPHITRAAEAAGCSREAHYDWMRDPEYARAFADAYLAGGDSLEEDAVERATNGLYEPVLYKGELVLDPAGKPLLRRKVSDKLLGQLLTGFKREKYGKVVQHTGTITHAHHVDLSELEEDELDALERLLGKARVPDHSGSDHGGTDTESGPQVGPDVPDDGGSEA